MSLQGRRVLVTGAGGFIGSHLCERLVAEGASVRAFCRYTSRGDVGALADVPEEVLGEIDVEFGDILDRDFVRRAARDVDVIMHLAASISVPLSYVAPETVVRTNVEGTLNVLGAARDRGDVRVVHLSSSEVYGTAQYAPIDEQHPLHVQSPYAASKVGADKLAESFHLSFGLPVVIARPFNTFGPRQSLRAVIPTVASQAVQGSTIELGSTAPTRDFVFVRDTAAALCRLGAATTGAGETFNIATGTDVSVDTVVEIVGELVGRELTVVQRDARMRPPTSEVFRLIGDAAKIRSAVGWAPETDLRQGLAAVVEWLRLRRTGLDADAYAA